MNKWYTVINDIYTHQGIAEYLIKDEIHHRIRKVGTVDVRWLDWQFSHISTGGRNCYRHTLLIYGPSSDWVKKESLKYYVVPLVEKAYSRSCGEQIEEMPYHTYEVNVTLMLKTFKYNNHEMLLDYLTKLANCASGTEEYLKDWTIAHAPHGYRQWHLKAVVLAISIETAFELVKAIFNGGDIEQFRWKGVEQITPSKEALWKLEIAVTSTSKSKPEEIRKRAIVLLNTCEYVENWNLLHVDYLLDTTTSVCVHVDYRIDSLSVAKDNIMHTLSQEGWACSWSINELPKLASPKRADTLVRKAVTLEHEDLANVLNNALNLDLEPEAHTHSGLMHIMALVATKRFGTEADIDALEEEVALHMTLCERDEYRFTNGNLLRIDKIFANGRIECTMTCNDPQLTLCGMHFDTEEAFQSYVGISSVEDVDYGSQGGF